MGHFAVPVLAVLRQVERTERADLLNHVVDDGFDPFAFRGGNPFQPHPLLFDAHVAQQALEHPKPAHGFVVALDIVAVAQMAAADQHPVRPAGQRVQNELRVHPARAHQADDADIRRVFHARHARQVGGSVSTPIAEERHNAGLPAGSRRRGLRCCGIHA